MIFVLSGDVFYAEALKLALFHAGHAADVLSSGEAALRLLDSQMPDLIIVDSKLPDMSPFAFVSEVRTHPLGRQIPLVVMAPDEPAPVMILPRRMSPAELIEHIERL